MYSISRFLVQATRDATAWEYGKLANSSFSPLYHYIVMVVVCVDRSVLEIVAHDGWAGDSAGRVNPFEGCTRNVENFEMFYKSCPDNSQKFAGSY
jgi:hypothetical protein